MQKGERRCGTQQGFHKTQERGTAKVCPYSDCSLAMPLFYSAEAEGQSVAAENQSFSFLRSSLPVNQGSNKVYGIRDQQSKMELDQGSQRRPIWDQKPWDLDQHYRKGIRDPVFRHDNKDHNILKCALIGGACQRFSIYK